VTAEWFSRAAERLGLEEKKQASVRLQIPSQHSLKLIDCMFVVIWPSDHVPEVADRRQTALHRTMSGRPAHLMRWIGYSTAQARHSLNHSGTYEVRDWNLASAFGFQAVSSSELYIKLIIPLFLMPDRCNLRR
jgi:hypothetical protein